jgi:hypothetical protein
LQSVGKGFEHSRRTGPGRPGPLKEAGTITQGVGVG